MDESGFCVDAIRDKATAISAQNVMAANPERAVIVADNAAFHKRTDTLNAIRAQGYELLFLPSYSSNLNPVEKKRAQAKMIRKKRRCNPYQLFETYLL